MSHEKTITCRCHRCGVVAPGTIRDEKVVLPDKWDGQFWFDGVRYPDGRPVLAGDITPGQRLHVDLETYITSRL